MEHNLEHKRKSIRLKGYDYSRAGLYFITICTKNRQCLFGNIANNELFLNAIGKMIEKWYYELEYKFPDIKCDEMIIMPNHFHCIVKNMGVGADLRVCPNPDEQHNMGVGADLRVCPNPDEWYNSVCPNPDERHNSVCPNPDERHNSVCPNPDERHNMGEHTGSPLHRVVQWFKTMSTNEYIRGVKNQNWKTFDGKLWQRNYWEHVIRDEKSYNMISEYIKNNPLNWIDDELFVK